MNFTEEELYYLKRLLLKHRLDLNDLVINEEDRREMAKEILKINGSLILKFENLS